MIYLNLPNLTAGVGEVGEVRSRGLVSPPSDHLQGHSKKRHCSAFTSPFGALEIKSDRIGRDLQKNGWKTVWKTVIMGTHWGPHPISSLFQLVNCRTSFQLPHWSNVCTQSHALCQVTCSTEWFKEVSNLHQRPRLNNLPKTILPAGWHVTLFCRWKEGVSKMEQRQVTGLR